MSTTGQPCRVLGLSGGCRPSRSSTLPDAPPWWTPPGAEMLHDSAAVLVCDGRIAAAIEEERLTRVKHTNDLAGCAAAACLQLAGLHVSDIDCFAYYGREQWLDFGLAAYMLQHPELPPVWSAREYLAAALSHQLQCPIDASRIAFVEHHLAHAESAYRVGPFPDALVVTLDGEGDALSGTVWAGEAGQLRRLRDLPISDSLGLLYLRTIAFLGYRLFDEYKVMGLASFGNPETFRPLFEHLCVLLPKGRFEVRLSALGRLRDVLPSPRRAREPVTQVHADLAAALQATIEAAALHLLKHFRAETGLRHLCLAGGVAHNSTMVGKIARAKLFDGVFVQPAAHDAGCAMGAALHVHHARRPDVPIARMAHVYLGRDLGSAAEIERQVHAWSELIDVLECDDVTEQAAQLLADGAVIGWVQGRSEFGPRALGNRSILADPRPAANRERINEVIKQRENYRPFAPAVLEEEAGTWFDMPAGTDAAFMTLTVPVRPQARAQLGAVTHVDGTARVQTVARATNERFWRLIEAFGRRTGMPVLLNTSFNHSVEPIVDSIDDAVACLLTTGIDHLVIDRYLIAKRQPTRCPIWNLVPDIPSYVRFAHLRELDANGQARDVFRCEHQGRPELSCSIDPAVFRLVALVDGLRTTAELLRDSAIDIDPRPLAATVEALWSQRLIRLLPRRDAGAADQPDQDWSRHVAPAT